MGKNIAFFKTKQHTQNSQIFENITLRMNFKKRLLTIGYE